MKEELTEGSQHDEPPLRPAPKAKATTKRPAHAKAKGSSNKKHRTNKDGVPSAAESERNARKLVQSATELLGQGNGLLTSIATKQDWLFARNPLQQDRLTEALDCCVSNTCVCGDWCW